MDDFSKAYIQAKLIIEKLDKEREKRNAKEAIENDQGRKERNL